jgi:multidrug efflux pump subunit AcrA (membrane-fusion protein)
MLDPSILISPNTPVIGSVPSQPGQVTPLMPDAQTAIELVNEAESRTRTLAAAIEMLSELDAAVDLDQAAEQVARSLCRVTSASRILVLWRQKSKRSLAVIGDSEDGGDDNENSNYRLAIAAGEEVAARDAITTWPPAKPSEGHALMAAAQLAHGLSTDALVGICLSDSNGRDCGVVLLSGQSNPTTTNFLRAIASPLASKLIGIERLQPTSLESATRGIAEIARGPRRNWILAAALAITLVMLVPLPYKIRSELELQPVKHRFVAVPFDGPLESSHVRPGDTVAQGDLLATINPREIEYELASIHAELNRVVQEKKGLMADHDFAGSKIAGLESDRLRLQTDLLQYRHDNLEIRSPIAGVVVSGDLKQSEGMPMSRGETLFEIAPLGEMVVEIAVPEDDVAHVREGMQVTFYVHALPSRSMSGTIARLHPKAELRNHDNIYVAEVHIRDDDNVLRPGMRGRAKIVGDRHTLGWNLFHKAHFALLRVVGW